MSGLFAEALSCFIFVPADVVKERLQVQHSKKYELTQYKNSFHSITTILKQEGVSGIYKGYGATLLSFGPFSALYFVFYEKMKLLSWRILDAQSRKKPKSPSDSPSSQGIRSENDLVRAPLSRGNQCNGYNTFNVISPYEELRGAAASHDNVNLPFPYLLGSSTIAAAMAAFITSPLDMAKLWLQVQRRIVTGGNEPIVYRNMIHALSTILAGGWRSCFQGAVCSYTLPPPLLSLSLSTGVCAKSRNMFLKMYCCLLYI